MDTKYWGPSGWRLLHLITFTYEPHSPSGKAVGEVFRSLPFVLPCKFCRASLHQYMEDLPLEPALKSREALSKWLFQIHCMVNDKLRGQRLLEEKDPSFESVKRVYMERVKTGCIRTEFEGLEFLFSIAENHPHCMAANKSTQLNCPPHPPKEATHGEKNQWNILSPGDRMKYYEHFWKHMGDALPFKEWREAWASCGKQIDTESRATMLKSLWSVRHCMEQMLDLVNRDTFQGVCKALKEHRSGCGKKKRAKTCRKTR
jgi:hypothetical protein